MCATTRSSTFFHSLPIASKPRRLSLFPTSLHSPRLSVISMASSNGNSRSSSHVSDSSKHAVILGGGVIGACTAYYLSQKGLKVTVVERCEVASSASGKAGGFLALDWCRGPLDQLARVSFRLHEQLAGELGGEDYGYRRVDTWSVSVREAAGGRAKGGKGSGDTLPAWVDGTVDASGCIGTTKSNAQVNPKLFTQTLLNIAIQKYGVSLIIGEAQEVVLQESEGNVGSTTGRSSERTKGKVTGVMVDGRKIPADVAVIAMGPWSSNNRLLGQLTKLSGLKAHSVILKPSNPNAISPHMLFLQYRTKDGRALEPEVYPRPNGEVYVCGMSEDVITPENPLDVQPSIGASAALCKIAATVSSELVDAECVAEQACLLPCSEDGIPIIGAIPGVRGAYVGTGHSCWGILNGPATGLALAELIAEGESSTVNLKSFSPQRFLVGARRG